MTRSPTKKIIAIFSKLHHILCSVFPFCPGAAGKVLLNLIKLVFVRMLKLRKNSRVPNEGLLRIQWIESISKTQQYDFHSTNFDISELHFTKEDFVERESSKVLNEFAIPSPFKTVRNSSELMIYVVLKYHFSIL